MQCVSMGSPPLTDNSVRISVRVISEVHDLPSRIRALLTNDINRRRMPMFRLLLVSYDIADASKSKLTGTGLYQVSSASCD